LAIPFLVNGTDTPEALPQELLQWHGQLQALLAPARWGSVELAILANSCRQRRRWRRSSTSLLITMNYAIISSTGLVVNTIEWDGATFWQPPAGHTAIATDEAGIGWTYANGTFIAPEPEPRPEPEPVPVLTTEQKLEAAGLTVAELKELFGLS
jgi:hypothetical protein